MRMVELELSLPPSSGGRSVARVRVSIFAIADELNGSVLR